MLNRIKQRILWVGAAIVSSLSACGGGGSSANGSPPDQGSTSSGIAVSWSGVVTAAGKPLTGAQLSIYAAGSNRSSAPVLLAQTITDSQGRYAVTSIPALPADGQLVYVQAKGGNTVAGAASNTAISLMSLSGAYCAAGNNCGFASNVSINELTTVAATYSLATYMSSAGTVSGNKTGIITATKTATSLVNMATGKLTPLLTPDNCSTATGVVNCETAQKINTLASILSLCTGSSAGSAACSNVLGSGTPSKDTLDLILSTATQAVLRNSSSKLFNNLPAAPLFAPVLSNAPADWNLALSFSGGGLDLPVGIAIDASGNVWVTNNGQANALSKFSADGTVLSPNGGWTGNGLSGPQGLAVDLSGRIWVANWAQGGGATISVFNNDGTTASGSPIGSKLINGIESVSGPVGLALTPDGGMWVANYSNASITKYNSSLQLQTGPVTGAGLSFPTALAVDNSGNVWLINNSNSSISEFFSNGVPVQSGAYKSTGLNAPSGLALSANGNLWVSNQVANSLLQIAGGSTPAPVCPNIVTNTNTGCTAISFSTGELGFYGPTRIAVDGAGNVWVANTLGNSVIAISGNGNPLSAKGGYRLKDTLEPLDVAIDAAGNVWVVNYGTSTLSKFIGIAAPVAVPRQGQPVSL